MMLPEKPPRLTSASNPIFAYILGICMLLIALNCFLRPRQEYQRFGLALENAGTNARTKSHSPLIYLKGFRELTYGLALIILQCQGNVDGVTATAGIISAAGLTDGLVVWFNGSQGMKYKTLGHLLAFVVFGSWAAWRARQAGEDSNDRWPDGPVHIWGS